MDFVLGEMAAVIEAKGASRVHDGELRSLRALLEGHRVKHALLVCLERQPRTVEPGIEILPWQVFLDRLWAGVLTN